MTAIPPSGQAAARFKQFCHLGQHADYGLAGDRGFARAGFQHRRRSRAIAGFVPCLPGDGNTEHDRRIGKAIWPKRNGLGLPARRRNRRPIGLGGAVDAGFRRCRCSRFAADQVMGEGKLDGADRQAECERAENSLLDL